MRAAQARAASVGRAPGGPDRSLALEDLLVGVLDRGGAAQDHDPVEPVALVAVRVGPLVDLEQDLGEDVGDPPLRTAAATSTAGSVMTAAGAGSSSGTSSAARVR